MFPSIGRYPNYALVWKTEIVSRNCRSKVHLQVCREDLWIFIQNLNTFKIFTLASSSTFVSAPQLSYFLCSIGFPIFVRNLTWAMGFLCVVYRGMKQQGYSEVANLCLVAFSCGTWAKPKCDRHFLPGRATTWPACLRAFLGPLNVCGSRGSRSVAIPGLLDPSNTISLHILFPAWS